MEIVKVTPYADRGLLRHRIEWVEGDHRGVADSHCTLTGVPLGSNWTLCVKHCRMHGHFSYDASYQIGLYAIGVIDAAVLTAFITKTTMYPDDAPERERFSIEGF